MINWDKFYQTMPRNEFEYSINISSQNSYIYFEIPKVACSTTKANLQLIEEKTLKREISAKTLSNIHKKQESPLLSPSNVGLESFSAMLENKNVFKFCFVRNPFTRALSAFLSKMTWSNPCKTQIANILNVEDDSEIAFEDFLTAVKQTTAYQMNPHWRVQTSQSFLDLVDYDFIGRFENFDRDLNTVLSQISQQSNYEVIDIRKNAPVNSTNALSKLQQLYNQRSEELVREIYEADFKNFSYSMDLPVEK